jgi:DNA polymerase-3 subunit alpha
MHAAIHDGKDLAAYHTPELKPILQDTYGILVYQEQIIRIAAELAGYEPGEADMIRKAVSKKKRDLMDEHKAKFTAGATARGLSRDVCEAIWSDVEFFARYGFNKAHAADYAVICCQTAYLKAYYPVEYIAALLTVDRHDTEKVAKYVTDARRLGITIAPPSLNRAGLDFTIEDVDSSAGEQGRKGAGERRSSPLRPGSPAPRPLIRYGLAAIKNVGEGAVQLIVEERTANGPFKDLIELAERIDLRRVGKRPLESMARVGVFDEWGSRSRILDGLDRVIGHSGSTHAAAEAGQMSLFGGNGSRAKIDVALLRPEKDIKPVDRRDMLDWEKELIGVYLTEHPLEHKLADLQNVVTARSGELDMTWNGKGVTLAGIVAGARTVNTKKGQAMAFVTLEDLDGKIDLVLFPRVWTASREAVQPNQILVVRGNVQANGEAISIIVNNVQTRLTIAQDASQTYASAKNGGSIVAEDDYWPPPDDSWYASEGDYDPASAGRAIAEASPAYPIVQAKDVLPPPEEEDGEVYEDEVAEQLTPPDPAAVEEAQEPMPPPVVAMPERPASDETPLNETADAPPAVESRRLESDVQPPVMEPQLMSYEQELPAVDAPPATNGQPLPSNGASKLLIVEIRASGNWKDACRQSLKLASRYEGNAMLRLQLVGQDLVMDFPNNRVGSAVELIEALERLPGVGRVYER